MYWLLDIHRMAAAPAAGERAQIPSGHSPTCSGVESQGAAVAAGLAGDGALDLAGEPVDRGREAVDGVERAVFAPAGDVGDALAVDRETEAGADDV